MYPKDQEVHTVNVTRQCLLLPGEHKLLFLESITLAPGGRMYVFIAGMPTSPIMTAAEAGLLYDAEAMRWYFLDQEEE